MLSLGQVTRPVGHGGRSGDSKEHPAVQFEQSQSNSSASLVERNADDDVHQPQTTSQVKQNKTKQNKTKQNKTKQKNILHGCHVISIDL